MRKLVIWTVIGIWVLLTGISYASTVGTIRGQVTDKKTGDPLPGVNVIIEGTNMGAATDKNGNYMIINVPVGEYTLTASMIGYKKFKVEQLRVIRDQTTWLNIKLESSVLAGEEVVVTADRPMVDQDVTGKKISVGTEEITTLPLRDLTELFTLQAGIIEVKSAALGIPGFEDRGIEQIHVRGGRANETGFMVDGMYIENPIYGGKGKGTRLNQYAVEEVDFQTGFFNAEYGDAMSGLVNSVTRSGGKTYSGVLRYETSALGAEQDRLRNFQKIAGGVGGPVPFFGEEKPFRFWVSGDLTTSADRIMEFDNIKFVPNNPAQNRKNKVNFLDRSTGWYAAGFDSTYDIFTRLDYHLSDNIKLYFSHWQLQSRFKTFSPAYLFYESGKNVVTKRSMRDAFEWRHQISNRTFYTIRASRFVQEMDINIRNYDHDDDGYPDWVEQANQSDENDANDIPIKVNDQDEEIPVDTVYNDQNEIIWTKGSDWNTWVTPDQYVTPQVQDYPQSAYEAYADNPDSLYYLFYREFYTGGADRYYHYTNSTTNEVRFDIESQLFDQHQIRGGVDYKRHELTFNEIQLPWLETPYTENYHEFPEEIGAYLQDKFEVPGRLVVNAGIRVDLSNPHDLTWPDPTVPTADSSKLVKTDWEALVSPRLGFSHVITDKSSFTFGYGVYYQNPTYRNVYLNKDDKADSTEFFNTPSPLVGNGLLAAQKVTSYEFGVKQQIGRNWGLSVIGWSKDYTGLNSTVEIPSGQVNYTVFVNYDYGSARGIDVVLEKRGGQHYFGMMQYTYSVAKANRADPWEGYRNTDNPLTMPKKEVLMPYDRSHDLSLQLTYRLRKQEGPRIANFYPFQHSRLSITSNLLSGAPYTPILPNDQAGATNSERMPWYFTANMAIRRYVGVGQTDLVLGVLIQNVFDRRNPIDVYPRTGTATDPGRRAKEQLNAGLVSSTYYDRPYYFDNPRSIDFFVEVEF